MKLSDLNRAIRRSRNLSNTRAGTIVRAKQGNTTAEFAIFDPKDIIQSYQAAGEFYEYEELNVMLSHFKGGLFVDVGGNVGNHSIFFALQQNCSAVITFEPNPIALRILQTNIALNNLQSKITVMPFGLGEKDDEFEIRSQRHNLGGARLHVQKSDDASIAQTIVAIKVGDDVLRKTQPTLIKIDIEGFEDKCLRGLIKTIEKHRPILFVELDDKNSIEVGQFLQRLNYQVLARPSRHGTSSNILYGPRG